MCLGGEDRHKRSYDDIIVMHFIYILKTNLCSDYCKVKEQ